MNNTTNYSLTRAYSSLHKSICVLKTLWAVCMIFLSATFLTACGSITSEQAMLPKATHDKTSEIVTEIVPEKGPHRGRLLRDGDITLELAIFETGVPPEFRAWVTKNGTALKPDKVDLKIKLTRLGGKIDDINFQQNGDALRGDTVIYEPHSFVVAIKATQNGITHTWEYDNFEGRTKIKTAVAEALKIETDIAGPVIIQKTISAYGKIEMNSERMRKITARFNGLIKSISVSQGEWVAKGKKLASIESDESLQLFTITAPISGVISQRDANVGEQTDGRQLFTIMDTRSVWAELAVFPIDLALVKVGTPVSISDTINGHTANGKVSRIDVITQSNQSVKVRVVLDNKNGQLRPGRHINAKITVGKHAAKLAVKRTGLQTYRDLTVVYTQVGEEYEVRMLKLGLQAGKWAEVLGGLEPGTPYVSRNSYVIKADIEKSGASHDH